MAEPSRIGVVGCGKQAFKHVAGLRSAAPALTIVAYDVDPERIGELAAVHTVDAAPSLEAIVADPAVDALIVSTPTPHHYDQIMQGLEAGKHVFCEKPLCTHRAEAEALAMAAERAGRVLQVGYVYRHVPAFRALHEALTAAVPPLGRPVVALLRIGGRGSHAAWKHRRASGGGVVNEMLVHMLDLGQWLFGRLDDVRWLERRLLSPVRMIDGETVAADADDFVLLSCTSASGARVVIQADLLTPAFRQYVEVQGSNGSYIGSIQAEMPCYFHLTAATGGMAAGRHPLRVEPVELFDIQMRDFLSRVSGRATGGHASADDTLHLLEILETQP